MSKSEQTEFVIYRSEVIHPQDHLSNLDILRAAEARNGMLELTGFLSRDHRHFVQFLEGQTEDLTKVMSMTERDPRHHSMKILASGRQDARQFADWDMGFAPVTGDKQQALGCRNATEIRTQLQNAARGGG
ncbi:BLUF domain-containing protein [Aliiroseovarius sp. PTFE2010]|uniref:BLUF domain-containing protein n=1 Tax=Aliiroseovarius sp. PTFE2010 TaxID=3417190 RepID=UPI003CED1BA7